MYQPNYSLTHKFVLDLVEFEVLKSQIEEINISSQSLHYLNKSTKAKDILHFAHILGVDLTLKDCEKAAEGNKIKTDDARGTILNNFRNAYEYIRANLSSSYIDLDINIILHFNKILHQDWKEVWDIKLRTVEKDIESLFDNWLIVRDQSISPARIQNELLEIIDWYKSKNDKISDIIRIAIVFYRLVKIAPLISLNKLSLIIIIDFLFYKNGYIDKSFFSIYRNIDIHEQEYLEAISYASENNDDVTLFVERFISALKNDMSDNKTSIQKSLSEEIKSTKQPFLDLNKRQLKILRYLQTIPTVKREDYVQMMDVSSMTSFRDLNDLVKKKLIKVEGKGRATKYMLTTR